MSNKVIIALVCLSLAGCASLKYPNWDRVTIANSVENKPCVKKGIKEKCSDSKDDCETWFKKRATLVNANTTVMLNNSSSNKFSGRYFQCEPGLPVYKDPKFNKEEYSSGSNTVTGQAFLRQKGGGIVTCAGESVSMRPDTEYFNDIFDDISNGYLSNNQINSEEKELFKVSQCDAQGNFEFYKIPAGKWVIRVNVSWSVYSVGSIPLPHGTYYYTNDAKQGGVLAKEVTVQNGEINKFIISE